MKKSLFLLIAFAVAMNFSSLSAAQGGETTLIGHLIDKDCAKRYAKKDHSREEVEKLVRICSLTEDGTQRSVGVLANGRFYEFDKRGNELAKLALEKAGNDKGATFKVVGRLSTTTVDRASIPGPNGSAIKVTGQKPARKMKVESVEIMVRR
jgi:hypothetical protein